MARESNNRNTGRIMVDVKCYGAATRQKGSGQISDLSINGALVTHTEITPVRGELVGISLDSPDGAILLVGWVVRHVDQGFAIEFDHLNEKTAAFINNAAAIVPSRGRGRQQED
jgi:hypothetical protein